MCLVHVPLASAIAAEILKQYQHDEVPFALRLNSHLLLGIVRIFSKQVYYLYNDCNDALVKIKMVREMLRLLFVPFFAPVVVASDISRSSLTSPIPFRTGVPAGQGGPRGEQGRFQEDHVA